jgi:PAS domain S-box-containing protein
MERADLEQWKAREVARLLALVETERRYYQEIVASIPVGLLVLSSDLSILSANRAIRKIFGLRGGDALRGRLDNLLPGWVLDRVSEVLTTGVAQTNVLVDTEGDVKRHLRIAIMPIRNWDDEAAQEALLNIEDLTGVDIAPQLAPQLAPAAADEPAAAPLPAMPVPVMEAPLVAVAEAMAIPASELIDNLNAVVWAVELPSMNFLFVSQQAEKMLGHPVDLWTSNPPFWSDRVHVADRDWVTQSYRQSIERGEGCAVEFRALTADGRIVWLRESARLLNDSTGRPNYLIGLTVDVTERRQLEDQLVQSERIDAMARLASRMAHDFNNMLMILTGYGEELLGAIPAGSLLRGDVQEILTATERMSGLTNQLLAFGRRQSVTAGIVALEPVLSAVAERLSGLVGDRLRIEFLPSVEANLVKADARQLENVVTSLVERARLAMSGAGRITIETSHVRITEDLRRADAPLRPGTYGVIAIANTGQPLEGEAKTTLFESVLTGRDPWDDAAAAAAQAYSIVRQWGGDIAVSNGPLEGSIFQVFLAREEETVAEPVVQQPEPAPVEPEPPAVPVEAEAPRLETILVVEDEAGIRALVRKILRRQGYEVLEAANGDDALTLFREHAGSIDMLITDVMMPQMGGRELADRLREQAPDLKVLYVSGYTDDSAIYTGSFPPGTAFLQKPFTLGSLLDKVKEVLSVQA